MLRTHMCSNKAGAAVRGSTKPRVSNPLQPFVLKCECMALRQSAARAWYGRPNGGWSERSLPRGTSAHAKRQTHTEFRRHPRGPL